MRLVKTYATYVENEYDYKGRDSILTRFKKEVQGALEKRELADYYFPEWGKENRVIRSKDGKLTILTWDWENNGSRHIYESMYRYVDDGKITSGYLYDHELSDAQLPSADYYEIHQLDDISYLVQAWGTYGGGKEYFIMRKLNFKNGSLEDCKKCFDGKDFLFYERNRGMKTAIHYDGDTKILSYPRLVPGLLGGEETGFYEKAGDSIRLVYRNSEFVKFK